jgi:hypothetical protein
MKWFADPSKLPDRAIKPEGHPTRASYQPRPQRPPDYDSEIDCAWFDPEWLDHHPEFPLAACTAEHPKDISEENAA